MQDFECYKTHFKSKVRIRMKNFTLTKTAEDGSMGTSWAGAETASNTSSVTASIDGLVDDRAVIDVAADTAAINSVADTMAMPLPTILPPVTIAGWDDEDKESSSDNDPDDESSSGDDPHDELPLADDAFLSKRVPKAVDTVGAKTGAASLGATTTGGGWGLAAFNAFAQHWICSRFYSADRDFGAEGSSAVLMEVVAEALFFSEVFDCNGDFGAVVAEAGDDTMPTLSPLVFFFLEVEDFDCIGDFGVTVVAEAGDFFFLQVEDFNCVGDFGATAACTEGTATAWLALTLPGTVEWERVWWPGFSGGLEVKKGGSPRGICWLLRIERWIRSRKYG
jgi:hypothetical protein